MKRKTSWFCNKFIVLVNAEQDEQSTSESLNRKCTHAINCERKYSICQNLRSLWSEFSFQVLQCELHAIQQACMSLENGYKPGITFIVVQKRHHAKFFAEVDRDKVSTLFSTS